MIPLRGRRKFLQLFTVIRRFPRPQIDFHSKNKMSKAEQLKEQGNKCFAAGNYQQAISYFTQAIKLSENAIYYSNRAACYLKLSNYSQALADATRATKLDPNY